MHLTIAVEHRFMRTPDAAVWTPTCLSRDHWTRYLGSFQHVRVLARVSDVERRDPRWLRVDGDGVDVIAIPYFVGPREYLRRWRQVRRAIRAALDDHPGDAVILRVPGTLGTIAAGALASAGRPFGVEVVTDPFDMFAPGSVDHPLRPVFRWLFAWRLRRLCASSTHSLYVTAGALQRRYPPARDGLTFSASDVELGEDAFIPQPRLHDVPGRPFRVITVGTLEQLYKGPDVLVRAVARCVADGLDAELVLVGDGRHRGMLEQLAHQLGIGARVRFAGQLPSGARVRAELDDAHVFVLPSRQEGLPRAMVEAMARGLPCLGTAVGGIPELLPRDALVRREPAEIAARIRELAANSELRAEISRRNLARAREFQECALQPVREAFYRSVIAAAREGSGALDAARRDAAPA